MFEVSVEVHRNLCAANIVVSAREKLTIASVNVNSRSLEVLLNKLILEGQTELNPVIIEFSDLDFEFLPCSIHSPDQKTVNVRAGINSKEVEIQDKIKVSLKDYLKKKSNYDLNCGFCSQIISSVFINQISEQTDDSELNYDWFCHNHSHSELPIDDKSSKRILGDTECMIGSTKFIVSRQNIEMNSMRIENNVARCSKCLSLLGQLKEESFAFYHHSIQFMSEGRVFHESIERTVLRLLDKNSSDLMSCKLALEGHPKPKKDAPVILLWLMNRYTTKFHTRIMPGVEIPKRILLSAEIVAKVLYRTDTWGAGIPRAWRKDFTSEVEEIGEDYILKLAQLLKDNSETVHPSQQNVEDYSVGFFKDI